MFVFDRQSELAFLKAADTWSFGVHFLLAKLAQVRYLPPYSPDLNPIELAFSKFKKLLRDGAERKLFVH